MNQQTLQNNLKQQFSTNDVITAKNTELYKLFGVKDTDNPYEVAKILNDYLYQTTSISNYNNGIYMPTLASYLFFLKNRKDLLDNLIVYKHVPKPYITIKKQIPQNNYTTLQKWMLNAMLENNKQLNKNSLNKLKQLIAANKDLKNYLSNNFFLMEHTENITILANPDNPSTNLKNLVVFENLKDGIGALLYKMLRNNIGIEQALAEANFIVLNGTNNLLNKLDDIVLYSSLTNTQNIVASENIAPEIVTALQGKIEDFYQNVGEKVPEIFKLSEFDFVKEAKRLIKNNLKKKEKNNIELSIA